MTFYTFAHFCLDFFFFPLPSFLLQYKKKGEIMADSSIAKAYPYANTNKPKEYYDYEQLQVAWG